MPILPVSQRLPVGNYVRDCGCAGKYFVYEYFLASAEREDLKNVRRSDVFESLPVNVHEEAAYSCLFEVKVRR